jgi:hypothetical protein
MPVPSRQSEPHDLLELGGRLLEPVVDDHVRELWLRLEFSLGGLHPAFDLVHGIGAATDEPGTERLARRRRDEHGQRLRHRLAHLSRPLDLDLEHDRHALGKAAVELGAQRPVPAAGVVGVLDELVVAGATVELARIHEVVVHPAALSGTRRARGRRHRQLELGHALEQPPDQRPLADS